jgi:hypothetical protein
MSRARPSAGTLVPLCHPQPGFGCRASPSVEVSASRFVLELFSCWSQFPSSPPVELYVATLGGPSHLVLFRTTSPGRPNRSQPPTRRGPAPREGPTSGRIARVASIFCPGFTHGQYIATDVEATTYAVPPVRSIHLLKQQHQMRHMVVSLCFATCSALILAAATDWQQRYAQQKRAAPSWVDSVTTGEP